MGSVKKGVKEAQKRTARERIRILFEQAVARPAYAKRYMQLVKKLQKRYRLRLTPDQNRKICKKCFAFLRPGVNATFRTKEGNIVITCKECGHVRRVGYRRRK